jgi:hypothetical protein
MTDHFALLKNELPTLNTASSLPGVIGFFGQETLRFHSIAGTILENFPLDKESVDERYITHILARSLLENYFWLLYIFDDAAQRDVRYGQYVNSFRREYFKLLNENLLPHKDKLEPANPAWATSPQGLDVNSMLAQVRNDYGDRLSYLYFIYRVASFDTHGNNLNNVFQEAFGKTCNFPMLNVRFGFDLIANQYLVILQELRTAGEI